MFTLGIGLIIAGAMKYYGYDWYMILIVLGVLAILKGIYCYYKK